MHSWVRRTAGSHILCLHALQQLHRDSHMQGSCRSADSCPPARTHMCDKQYSLAQLQHCATSPHSATAQGAPGR